MYLINSKHMTHSYSVKIWLTLLSLYMCYKLLILFSLNNLSFSMTKQAFIKGKKLFTYYSVRMFGFCSGRLTEMVVGAMPCLFNHHFRKRMPIKTATRIKAMTEHMMTTMYTLVNIVDQFMQLIQIVPTELPWLTKVKSAALPTASIQMMLPELLVIKNSKGLLFL